VTAAEAAAVVTAAVVVAADVDDTRMEREAGGDAGLGFFRDSFAGGGFFSAGNWRRRHRRATSGAGRRQSPTSLEAPMQKFAVALVQIVFVAVVVSHTV
jgi:hypothetical protein